MAIINRTTLLNDTKNYLGPSLTLSEALISSTNESVILKVGDDDTKYSEVLCKSLYACAELEKLYAVGGSGSKKKTKVGPIEEEFYQSTAGSGWDDYKKTLPNICPLLPGGGYTVSRGIGIDISPGDEIDVNDTSACYSDLYL